MILLYSARKTFIPATSRYYTSATFPDSPLNLLHLLQLSLHHQSLKLTKQSHARILSIGSTQNPFLTTKLISAYAVTGNQSDSRLVFNSIENKTVYIWNTLINGYVKNHAYNEAFELFNEMCRVSVVGLFPDDFTLATASKACAEIGDLNAGKSVHGKGLRSGFISDIVFVNSIMSMYTKCGDFIDVRKVFDEMPQRNVGSWNVLISGFVNYSCFDKDLKEIVDCMLVDGVKLDAFTISSLLPLCGLGNGGFGFHYGRELHCYIVKNGLDMVYKSDVHLGCCLIDLYSRFDKVSVSRKLFDRLETRNVYAWTAMINGYIQNGMMDEGFDLFRVMQVKDEKKNRIEPNKVSLITVLPACSSIAGLINGKQIHGFAIRKELNRDVALSNALIDMYSKCGNLNSARVIFDFRNDKDIISWSTMISGYGLHGKGQEAIFLYEQMMHEFGKKPESEFGPDVVAIVGVLSACGRSGLVNEAVNIYNRVVNDYGAKMKDRPEICACMVDILGRAGQLDRALRFINEMGVKPGASVWGALVSASVMHGDLDMHELAVKWLIRVEPDNPSNYVALSNLNAGTKKWDAVADVRMVMKEKGLRKVVGCSWISVNGGTTHCFCVADKTHRCTETIYEMVENLVSNMKGSGYCYDFENVIYESSDFDG